MKLRHEEQLQALQERLERNFKEEHPVFSSQLQGLRRMQRTLVRHKRFAEALDLLKVAESTVRRCACDG